MKNQSTGKSATITEKTCYYSLGLLTLLAVVVNGAVQATPAVNNAAAVAAGSGVATAEVTAAALDDTSSDTNKVNQSAPAWQPPVAPKIITPSPVGPEEAKRLAERWGVQLLSLRVSAAGMMMDFRFRVLDADKALPLFDHNIKPYLVVERSQAKLPVPMAAKVGSFRTTNRGKNIKADRNYYMMFANPDRHVKIGDKVSLIIGDFKVEELTVN